jgi:hypothetical protein
VRKGTLAEARCSIEIPAELVDEKLVGSVRVLGPDGEVDDQARFGPFEFVERQRRKVVLVRPAVVGRSFARVSAAAAGRALSAAAARLGLAIQRFEPALLADAEVTLPALPAGEDMPATVALLETLNVLAARNPGLEDALWLAVVPGEDGAAFADVEPADAAVAVGVCTLNGVEEALLEPLDRPQARTLRLRVVGSLDPDGAIRLDPLRVEERSAGQGSPLQSDLALHLLAGPALRARQALRLQSDARPTRFVALLPLGADVDVLEVREDVPTPRLRALRHLVGGADRLPLRLVSTPRPRIDFDVPRTPTRRRVVRPPGAPELSKVKVADGKATWSYAHSASARSAFTVEISRGDAWSPIAFCGHCSESVELPLELITRSGESERVRVVAVDGWNAHASRPASLKLPLGEHRAIARNDGGRLLWADLDFDAEEFDPESVRWRLDGSERTGMTLLLPARYTGEVELRVDTGTDVFEDRRNVRDGRVLPRGAQPPASS